jgi:hypothetical protein
MLIKASLLPVMFLAACAVSEEANPTVRGPTPASPPPAPFHASCGKTGQVLFSSVTVSQAHQGTPALPELKLYESGAITYKTGDRSPEACLTVQMLASMREQLAQIPWQLTHHTIVCRAIPDHFVEYTIAGKAPYDAVMCPTDTLDTESLDKLHAIEKQLVDIVTATPPCCKP